MNLNDWLGLFGYGILPAGMVVYALIVRFGSPPGRGKEPPGTCDRSQAVLLATTVAFCVGVGLVIIRLLGSMD